MREADTAGNLRGILLENCEELVGRRLPFERRRTADEGLDPSGIPGFQPLGGLLTSTCGSS